MKLKISDLVLLNGVPANTGPVYPLHCISTSLSIYLAAVIFRHRKSWCDIKMFI